MRIEKADELRTEEIGDVEYGSVVRYDSGVYLLIYHDDDLAGSVRLASLDDGRVLELDSTDEVEVLRHAVLKV